VSRFYGLLCRPIYIIYESDSVKEGLLLGVCEIDRNI